MTYGFWLLFVYITILAIFQAYHRFFEHNVDDMKVTPDDRGIIGEIKDDDGDEYYAVLIPKDEYDKAWDRAKRDDNE